MKRNSKGIPVTMFNRWSRPPLSCRPCREKKRRCDRNQPCSNCKLRNISCQYTQEQSFEPLKYDEVQTTPSDLIGQGQRITNPSKVTNAVHPHPPSLNAEDVLHRIRKLEEAVFNKPKLMPSSSSATGAPPRLSNETIFVPFSFHLSSKSQSKPPIDLVSIARQLPPIEQARELLDYFALTSQLNFGFLHIPSTKDLMEQTYQIILEGKNPGAAALALLFTIFAGAAFGWTPENLQNLSSSQAEASAASLEYTRLALSILDNPHHPLDPTTTALEAMCSLSRLLVHFSEFIDKAHVLWIRSFVMARKMEIHRLDTIQSRNERKIKGYNMVEIEVKRRIWWILVSFDWLAAFAGGPNEGAYIVQPKHMNVRYPSNVDDDFITPTSIEQDFPLSAPTTLMSSFIERLKIADLCRQVVDVMPPMLDESQEPQYAIILMLDKKFHDYLEQLPVFFRLDPISIQQSEEACKERPTLALQRVGIQFMLHTRLCRLHRRYHLEGLTNPNCAYSRTVCIRSAQTVLELRRLMDDLCVGGSYLPARSWVVMEHVFLAALVLAIDVAFDPDGPGAKARKAKVLAAYQTLERSKEDSKPLMNGLQKNMQTLISTLQNTRSHTLNPYGERDRSNVAASETTSNGNSPCESSSSSRTNCSDKVADIQDHLGENLSTDGNEIQGNVVQEGRRAEEEHWNQLWSEFLDVSQHLEAPQWSSLLDDIDFSFEPGV